MDTKQPEPMALLIAKLGSKAAIAKLLGVSRAAVTGWGDKIPPGRALALSRATGIPAEQLLEGERRDPRAAA